MLYPFIKITTDEGELIENNVVSCVINKSNVAYPTCTFVLSSAGRMKPGWVGFNEIFVEQKTELEIVMGYNKVDDYNSDDFKAESNIEFEGIVISVEEVKGRFTVTCVDLTYTLRNITLKAFKETKKDTNLIDKVKEAVEGTYDVETDDYTKNWFVYKKFIQVTDTNVFSFITKFITQARVNIFIKDGTLYIWSPYHRSGKEIEYDSTKNIVNLKLPAKKVEFKKIVLNATNGKKTFKVEQKSDGPEEIIKVNSPLINSKEKLEKLLPIIVKERRSQRNKITVTGLLYPFTQPYDKVTLKYLQLINDEFDPNGPFKNQYEVATSHHFVTNVAINFSTNSIKRTVTLEPYEISGNQ